MKKTLLLMLVVLTALTTSAATRTIWEGSKVIDWNENRIDLSSTLLGAVNAGDCFVFTYEVDGSVQWPSFQLNDTSWNKLEGVSLSAGMTSSNIYATPTMAIAAASGLMITGTGCTMKKIELVEGDGGDYSNAVWIGETVIDGTWSKYQQVSKSVFANAKTGQKLRLKYKDLGSGAMAQLKTAANGWPAITGVETPTLTGTYYDFTITESMLAEIQANDLIVTGVNYTLISVELLSDEQPATTGETYNAWTGETTIGNWVGWQQIGASAFANATVGQILRIKFKNLGAGAYLSLRNPITDWPDLTDATATYIAGNKQDYTITSAMLSELKANGLVIGGVNFTVTSVDVINASELKPLTLTVPVTDNWLYEGTAVPTFTVSITNPYAEAVEANIQLTVATDKMKSPSSTTAQKTVAAGATENVTIALDAQPAAGIYHATITVNDDLARAFYFAVRPTEIVSAPDKQSDFDSYWAAAKEQLAAVPLNATLTEIPAKSSDKRKVYLVEMQSIADGLTGDPVTIRGYYCEPTDGQKHPVLIHYQGYDSDYRPGGDSATPWCPNANWDTEEGANWAEFILSNRGQSVNNRPASGRDDGIEKDFENIYGDWFAYEFGNKDKYYYRGAYMDCLRAIDFMASRETSDMQNLFAEGQSQGGAFTVAAAALSDHKFNAIAPAITFMGDFPDYFEITSWPASVAKENQGTMTDEEMYAFLSYYDTKNLATNITSPYITSIGLQDNVCPPHTNIAPYNNAQTADADKDIVYNAGLQHATNGDWNETYMTFFKKYMKNTTGIKDVRSQKEEGKGDCFDLQGRKVERPTKGLYIISGRKYAVR